MVHPYFFAHHHFHRRKIESLRTAGIQSWILSFIPETLFQEHHARYKNILSEGFTKIIRVPHVNLTNRAVLKFFLTESIHHKVLVHILRTDPAPIIRLRQWPILRKRIMYILEYEGDIPLEYLYQNAYLESPRPPSDPTPELKDTYENLLRTQIFHAQKADGLVLMSHEQIALMEARLGRSIRACWLPTLPDPNRVRFDDNQRDNIRNTLGIEDRLVLVYIGNVITKWQRLDAMCQFVAQLSERIPKVWFLLLVRIDDLNLAKEAVKKYDLENRATVQFIDAKEVPDYLSASDFALFLRHIHPMNIVVSSGKLGEYLAAGLPIITTGANSEFFNQIIRNMHAGIFVDDSLPVNDKLIEAIEILLENSRYPGWRSQVSHKMEEQFSGENDPFQVYTSFIIETIGK